MVDLLKALEPGARCTSCELAKVGNCVGFMAIQGVEDVNKTFSSLDYFKAYVANDMVRARMLGEAVALDTYGDRANQAGSDYEIVQTGLKTCRGAKLVGVTRVGKKVIESQVFEPGTAPYDAATRTIAAAKSIRAAARFDT